MDSIDDKVTPKLNSDVKVAFLKEAWVKMMFHAKHADGEVSGLGTVEERDGLLVVTDTFIFNQEADSASVEIDPESIADMVFKKFKAGDKDFSKRLRFWWHSHASMGCFHSGTDTGTEKMLSDMWPYTISVVVNKQQKFDCALIISKPTKARIEKVPVFLLLSDEEKKMEAEILKEKKKADKLKDELDAKFKKWKAGKYKKISDACKKDVEKMVRKTSWGSEGVVVVSRKKNDSAYNPGYAGGYNGYDDDYYKNYGHTPSCRCARCEADPTKDNGKSRGLRRLEGDEYEKTKEKNRLLDDMDQGYLFDALRDWSGFWEVYFAELDAEAEYLRGDDTTRRAMNDTTRRAKVKTVKAKNMTKKEKKRKKGRKHRRKRGR